MEDLMVVGPGAVVGKESKRFIITLKDKSIIEVPDYKVNVINIFGNNQFPLKIHIHLFILRFFLVK